MELKDLTQKVKQVSSQYRKKFGIDSDDSWYILKLQEELGELIQTYLMLSKKARSKNKTDEELKKDFAAEVADVMGHILLLADHFNIDLDQTMKDKWLRWLK